MKKIVSLRGIAQAVLYLVSPSHRAIKIYAKHEKFIKKQEEKAAKMLEKTTKQLQPILEKIRGKVNAIYDVAEEKKSEFMSEGTKHIDFENGKIQWRDMPLTVDIHDEKKLIRSLKRNPDLRDCVVEKIDTKKLNAKDPSLLAKISKKTITMKHMEVIYIENKTITLLKRVAKVFDLKLTRTREIIDDISTIKKEK